MKSGVRKSGWPMPRLMMSRPCAASILARASTANAFSSPMRSKAAMVFNMAFPRWYPVRSFDSSRAPHHGRPQLLDRRRADLLHHRIGFRAQKLEHALDPALTEGAEAPDVRPADAHRIGADAQRLDHVGAAAETAVDDDRDAALYRLHDFRQRVDGRAPGILAARAMIGH